MSPVKDLERNLFSFASRLYTGKDTMHDWTHIERVRRRALQFSETWPCDRQTVSLAACLHGVIQSDESHIRAFLAERGLSRPDIDRLVAVAWESQKETKPEFIEGRLLHDAHLLEGDENFLITKSLVTGSARGQSLAQTLAHFEANLGRHRCYFPENQSELARREQIAREYIRKLKAEL